MARQIRQLLYLLLAVLLLAPATLGWPGGALAQTEQPLCSLEAGDTVSFAGYTWIVLSPETGYLLMQQTLKTSNGHEIGVEFDSTSPQSFNNSTSISSYLNGTGTSNGWDDDTGSIITVPDFLGGLTPADQNLIQAHTWNTGPYTGSGDAVSQEESNTYTCKVGLVSYSECYNLTNNGNNLSIISNLNTFWWMITPYSGSFDGAWMVNPYGNPNNYGGTGIIAAIRPALYLNPDILIAGGNGGTVTTNTDAATQLAYSTNALTGTASNMANIGPITVTSEDANGYPCEVSSNTTVTLSSSTTGTAVFSVNSKGAAVTSVVVPAASDSVSFYYGDTAAGTPAITAESSGLTAAQQNETIYPVVAPTITGPANQTATAGGTATFSVTATSNDNGTIAYRWQVSMSGNGDWSDATAGSGVSASSYTTPTLVTGDNGKEYRCAVADSVYGTVYSSVATLTVNAANAPTGGGGGGGAATAAVPTVQTVSSSSITGNSASLVGDIVTDNGNDITDYGFLWGTSSGALTNKLAIGTNKHTGAFTATLDKLTAGTAYYFEAYAANSQGTGKGTPLSFTTTGAAPVTATPTTTATAPAFSDVPSTYWGYEAISSLGVKGIVNGYPDGTFQPNDNITRAEFATMLVKALGLPNLVAKVGGSFLDVTPNGWYFNSVNTAVYAGLVSGMGNELFAPNVLITREEMAVMVAKALDSQAPAVTGTELNSFSDSSSVSSWAVTGLEEAVKAGIVSGMIPGTLAPQANATRAQAAEMIYKLLDVLGW